MREARPIGTRAPIGFVTLLAMLAFAGNSLLCRAALRDTGIDAGSFTGIRILSGAITLWLIVALRAPVDSTNSTNSTGGTGNWPSAWALFVYAAAFSYAYVGLPTGTGALLLFGAVQATMIGFGLWRGERLGARQNVGLVLACAGLIGLVLPGLTAPPLRSALLMLSAGVAWGIYSLRGKGAGDPTRVTTGNFVRASLPALGLAVVSLPYASLDAPGVGYAVASGAVTSGLGYAVWYAAVRQLRATTAATVQLSVPVIAALGGIVLLGEPLTWRLTVASIAILSGIALVILHKPAT